MRGLHKSPVVAVAFVLAAGALLVAQTPIKLPKNKYTPEQDVKIGLEGAAEIRKQYPIIKDEAIQKYLTGLGDRLVAVAPANLKQPVYKYSFTPVNLKEINAFALPGGPMFVHRGMFDAAAVEGEVVGVMAHELAHVLLRHGTANATKAQNPWLQLGQIAGQVGGAMVGGNTGALIAEGSGFGLGTLMLRYGRDYEKQADLLGAQIMAKAGYDPRDLAHMFETISGESKGGAPQWLSSHPNPGNRTQYITKEAEALKIEGKADTSGFPIARKQFAGLPPAMTMAELAKRGPGGSGSGSAPAESVGTPGKPVPAPSAQMRTINAGIFNASVPSNWKNLQSDSTIKVVPENGYGEMKGQTVFTHGIEFGVAKASSRDLKEATSTWLKAVAQGNPELKQADDPKYVKISDRTALGVPLVNPSPLGGQEVILLFTTFLSSGELFYYLAVAPEADMKTYQPVFVKIAQSIKITDVR
jgi:Zn-dependent protease with chaperone function